MKTVKTEELQANLEHYLEEVQREAIVITRGGKPCAVLHSVGDDLETAELAHSPEFWKMIEQRRGAATIPWEKAKSELGL